MHKYKHQTFILRLEVDINKKFVVICASRLANPPHKIILCRNWNACNQTDNGEERKGDIMDWYDFTRAGHMPVL